MTAKQIAGSLHAPDGSYYVTLTDGSGTLAPASGATTDVNTIITDPAGTNQAAVKAASTAPLATDPALVVSISPNSVNANGKAIAANSAPVTVALAATGTQTSVASSASDVTILAANTARIGFSVYNDSAAATLYLLTASGTSSTTNYSTQVGPGALYENTAYAGLVKGIWSAASGNARVTELT